MDFSNFEYHKDKVPSDYTEREKYFQSLIPVFIGEMKASPVAMEFLSHYDPNTWDAFMKWYAERKSFLANSYDYYISIKPKRELKFREMAEAAINAIKQKKLFNLQLQWRAEIINIPEIRFCYEFVFWSKYIEDCSFLPRITETEVNLMKKFLKEEENALESIDVYHGDYQDYDSLMVKDEEGLFEDMLAWYEYYDNYLGTGSLLLLPDKRGEKEEFYMDLSREEQRKKAEEEKILNPPKPYIPPLPSLRWNEEALTNFSRVFETDKHFRKLFEIYKEETERETEDEGETELMEEAIRTLEDATETVIMPGGLPWKKAIIRCAQIYEAEMVCRELDVLYQEICMLEELGISKGGAMENIKEVYEKDGIVKIYYNHIINGRKLNGEPADFNF